MSVYGKRSCDTCQWWGREREHNDNYPYGRCRANPPAMGEAVALPYHDPDRPEAAGPIIHRAEWPWSAIDDTCGRWTPTDAHT